IDQHQCRSTRNTLTPALQFATDWPLMQPFIADIRQEFSAIKISMSAFGCEFNRFSETPG
ncbi:MAG: hypothetical protein V3R25_00840, partial [Nitrosomonadaceae bacterium]